MKAFLNFLGQFGEVNFRNSRFGFDDDAIRIDTSDSGLFVFPAVNRFEVLRESAATQDIGSRT